MKKSLRLLSLAIMALAISMPALANKTLTVCDGDETGYAPIETSYLDVAGTRTQVIYPAEMLVDMRNEVINAVRFYTTEPLPVTGGTIKVLAGETTRTEFIGNDYVDGLTQVATISMTANTSEVLITFDTPMLYQSGNLVIETYIEQATECCYIPFIGIRPSNYTMTTRGEVSKFLPKATFDYGIDAEYNAKVFPNDVTFNVTRIERQDVQTVTLFNIGQQGFCPVLHTDSPFLVEQPDTILAAGESMEIAVTFAPETMGEHKGTLTIDCGHGVTLEVALHGTASVAADDLVVGDETDYASFVPIYGPDIDVVGTEGQMIYPADMLAGMMGKDIYSLKFHTNSTIEMNGGTIQLSFKVVDENEFTSEALMTELTAVATVSPEYGGTDLTFDLDEPYHYNGGNLLVACKVIEPGVTNHRQTFFYGTPVEYNCGVYRSIWYADVFDIALVPFMPKVTFSYSKQDLLRGDVDGDGSVTINDVTALIDILLSGSGSTAASDCDLDSNVSINDVTALIDYLLSGHWSN